MVFPRLNLILDKFPILCMTRNPMITVLLHLSIAAIKYGSQRVITGQVFLTLKYNTQVKKVILLSTSHQIQQYYPFQHIINYPPLSLVMVKYYSVTPPII